MAEWTALTIRAQHADAARDKPLIVRHHDPENLRGHHRRRRPRWKVLRLLLATAFGITAPVGALCRGGR